MSNKTRNLADALGACAYSPAAGRQGAAVVRMILLLDPVTGRAGPSVLLGARALHASPDALAISLAQRPPLSCAFSGLQPHATATELATLCRAMLGRESEESEVELRTRMILHIARDMAHPDSRVFRELSSLILDPATPTSRLRDVLACGHVYSLVAWHLFGEPMSRAAPITSIYSMPVCRRYERAVFGATAEHVVLATEFSSLDAMPCWDHVYHTQVVCRLLAQYAAELPGTVFPLVMQFLCTLPGYDAATHCPYDLDDAYLMCLLLASCSPFVLDDSLDHYTVICHNPGYLGALARHLGLCAQVILHRYPMPCDPCSPIGKHVTNIVLAWMFEAALNTRIENVKQLEHALPEAKNVEQIHQISDSPLRDLPADNSLHDLLLDRPISPDSPPAEKLSQPCHPPDSLPAEKLPDIHNPPDCLPAEKSTQPFQPLDSLPAKLPDVHHSPDSLPSEDLLQPRLPSDPLPAEEFPDIHQPPGSLPAEKYPDIHQSQEDLSSDYCAKCNSDIANTRPENSPPKIEGILAAKEHHHAMDLPVLADADVCIIAEASSGAHALQNDSVLGSRVTFEDDCESAIQSPDYDDVISYYWPTCNEFSCIPSSTDILQNALGEKKHTTPERCDSPEVSLQHEPCSVLSELLDCYSHHNPVEEKEEFLVADQHPMIDEFNIQIRIDNEDELSDQCTEFSKPQSPIASDASCSIDEPTVSPPIDLPAPRLIIGRFAKSTPAAGLCIAQASDYDAPTERKSLTAIFRRNISRPQEILDTDEDCLSSFAGNKSPPPPSTASTVLTFDNDNFKPQSAVRRRLDMLQKPFSRAQQEVSSHKPIGYLVQHRPEGSSRNAESANRSEQRGNRKLISNALHILLAGSVNAQALADTLLSMKRSAAENFVILLTGPKNHRFRGLYAVTVEAAGQDMISKATRVSGFGPKELGNGEIIVYFKYDCGSRSFKELPTRQLCTFTHGIALRQRAKTS